MAPLSQYTPVRGLTAPRGLARVTGDLRKTVSVWLTRRRTRGQLALLDGHLRRDIGLVDREIDSECAKRFWQA